MSGAYAQSGVDTGAADRAVGALVGVLRTIDIGSASRSVLESGHYAAVLEVAPNLGIAVGTDGVGSKLIVAEQTGRYDTVGIDCIAMNVNDVICVGAEPFAVLDYLAVERADEDVMRAIGVGLKEGAEQAGVEIPGGEVAVLPELIRGHPSPGGFDLTAACFGTVALDAAGDRRALRARRRADRPPVLGHPLQRLLARPPGARRADYDDRPDELGGATVADALLEPTVIYVRAVLELLRSDCRRAAGSPTSPAAGCSTSCACTPTSASTSPTRCPCRGVFDLIRRLGEVGEPELWEVFNMGCGFCVVVPEADADAAVALLARHHPGARRIGTITGDADRLAVPPFGVVGDACRAARRVTLTAAGGEGGHLRRGGRD